MTYKIPDAQFDRAHEKEKLGELLPENYTPKLKRRLVYISKYKLWREQVVIPQPLIFIYCEGGGDD